MRTLIDEAVDKYGDWLTNTEVMFPAGNISVATEDQLQMILALLQDDHLPEGSVGESTMDEFKRWARGEDVTPWSPEFVLNWLVLRRQMGGWVDTGKDPL